MGGEGFRVQGVGFRVQGLEGSWVHGGYRVYRVYRAYRGV